ncbi:zona occludens toxin [Variovorax sp. SG517]|uniref:zonular occludens toxin domain-containing protein n=1 Tax=Variovorax sp. SG517 TaxID=2587117 RepID=UPI00159E7C7D|nr:zonular occludens toxin domain-containing protein [Variovorax sp. SG517]NVM90709.1 zona occludens toxin [Variovorax sp. SG517]
MLYLRTGANGSCKTLFTLKDVREMQMKELRPVCYNGRFKLKPEKLKEFGWKLIDFKDWQAEPDGTIFLMDECHLDLPKRPNGSAVPLYVSKLAEHRARGFDFFLLTQHPSNIDSFVTKLVGSPGWHQHLKRAFGASNMTSVLQWSAVNNTCEKDGSGKSAQVTMRGQPKEVYDWYDSAELHTGKRKIPKQFWMVVVGVPVALSMMYMAGKLLWDRTHKAPAVAAGSASASGAVAGASGAARERPSTPAEYAASYRPRIEGLMHTAPVYDKLTEPKRVPVAAACISMPSKGCKCFTQDATPYPIDQAMCEALVKHGAFYAFAAEGERRAFDQPQTPRQSPETALPAPSGIVLIDSGGKSPGAPTAIAAAPAPAPQPRVQPGSKWSFQTGGE